MEKVQPLLDAAEVRALVETLFLQLDQSGGSVKTRAHNLLAEKQRRYSGPAYLDQIERNVVYLSESTRLVNTASAYYLCVGGPTLSPDEAVAFAHGVGTDEALRAAILHLAYVRSGSCPGCKAHADHHRYKAWRDLRRLGDWPKYIEQMELSYTYSQALVITAQMLLVHLLTTPQLAGIARRVPPAEVTSVVTERVELRTNLWLDHVKWLEIPGLEQKSGQEKNHPQRTPAPAGLTLAMEHWDLGATLSNLGRWDEAIHEYRTALSIIPNNAVLHYNLGGVYLQQGRTEEAIRELELAVRINPDFAEARYSLAVAHYQQGHLDEAIRGFRAVLHLKCNDADAHAGLGWAYGLQGRWYEAIPEYQAALRINPHNSKVRAALSMAHLNLGVAYGQYGRWDEAIRELRAAVHIQPNFGEAHYNLGVAFREQGHLDEALQEADIALQLGFEPAYQLLTSLNQDAKSANPGVSLPPCTEDGHDVREMH